MTSATKEACIMHHVMLNCNCTDTKEFKAKRSEIVQKLMHEYYQTHQDVPPCELIERWLGEWK